MAVRLCERALGSSAPSTRTTDAVCARRMVYAEVAVVLLLIAVGVVMYHTRMHWEGWSSLD